jgi:hypothetical protein
VVVAEGRGRDGRGGGGGGGGGGEEEEEEEVVVVVVVEIVYSSNRQLTRAPPFYERETCNNSLNSSSLTNRLLLGMHAEFQRKKQNISFAKLLGHAELLIDAKAPVGG